MNRMPDLHRSYTMSRIVLLVLLSVLPLHVVDAIDLDADQTKVWQVEELYWKVVAAGDVDGYSALFHENFIGWPCTSDTPKGTQNSSAWVKEIRDNKWTLNYTLRPEAVQLFDDVAVVHYAAEYVFDYGNGTRRGEGDWRKFTHTWLKKDGRWLLIGGMCADQKPVRSLLK